MFFGNFFDGKPDGICFFNDKDFRREGEFKNGLPFGKITMTYHGVYNLTYDEVGSQLTKRQLDGNQALSMSFSGSISNY